MRFFTGILICISFAFGCGKSSPMTYKEYVNTRNTSRFLDPVGASNIYNELRQGVDSCDEWWKFEISEADFNALAQSIATADHGPASLKFDHELKLTGKPLSSDLLPSWWQLPQHGALQVAGWCYGVATGDERHHGWNVIYSKEKKTAWVWYWNHQWSTDECSSPTSMSNK